MNPARRGNAAAFSMAIKDNLFPKIKFLQGTNASLDFSMDTTSICGFLRICCGVAENDAYQWWEEHRILLKNIHTDCRNNKIKMIKQQFNGEFIYPVSMLYVKLRYTAHIIACQQAWIKEDENEALNTLQNALSNKCYDMNPYIKFIKQFGPALTGVALWNNNKSTKLVSELLTIMDEAFIHLCIINYSATWKAQERQKLGETDVQVPVSYYSPCNECDFCEQQVDTTNSIIATSLLGSPRLQARPDHLSTKKRTKTATCHVDGLKLDSKPSTNWPKKSMLTAKSMVRNLTRPSRKGLSKKWPAPTKQAKERGTILTHTMI
jgi:hypothetical protein